MYHGVEFMAVCSRTGLVCIPFNVSALKHIYSSRLFKTFRRVVAVVALRIFFVKSSLPGIMIPTTISSLSQTMFEVIIPKVYHVKPKSLLKTR